MDIERMLLNFINTNNNNNRYKLKIDDVSLINLINQIEYVNHVRLNILEYQKLKKILNDCQIFTAQTLIDQYKQALLVNTFQTHKDPLMKQQLLPLVKQLQKLDVGTLLIRSSFRKYQKIQDIQALKDVLDNYIQKLLTKGDKLNMMYDLDRKPMTKKQQNNLRKFIQNWDDNGEVIEVKHFFDTPSINQTQNVDLLFQIEDVDLLVDFIKKQFNNEDDTNLFSKIFKDNDEIDAFSLKCSLDSYGEENSLMGSGLEFFDFSDLY